ncbi:MAG: DUF885 domain-containing protein [Anaerolineales bacterium]|nr:DUF885 domain-containing protein [Anaerolineales bacterium]
MKNQKQNTILSGLMALIVLLSIIASACSPIAVPQAPAAPLELEQAAATEQPAAPVPPGSAAAQFQGLEIDEFFEASYRELLLRNPELVLELGLEDTYGVEQTNLTDISDEYIRQTQGLVSTILETLHAYDRETLPPDQQISYDVYEAFLEDLQRGQEYQYNDYLVTFLITNGIQVQLLHLFTEIHPITNKQDAEDYITRLGQVESKIEQVIVGLEKRAQNGVIAPVSVFQWPLGEIQSIAYSPADQTPYYSAFKEKLEAVEELSDDEKQSLLKAAEKAIDKSVVPGYKALANEMNKLSSKAPHKDGLVQFEDGQEYYAYLLRHFTTTNLSADEIHELGLQEIERIQSEMRAIFAELGYPEDWSLSSLYNKAFQDSGFVSGDQMPETYENILRQAEDNLSQAFDMRPKAELIVIGGPAGNFYSPGSLDGSRPGAFYASTTSSSPRMNMPTLAYHEGIPGHHFQIALAQESDLPTFRNVVDFTAYTEGWALYSERLAWELGWYENDPYGDLGRLQAEAFRATRLVVDTGIHTKGWSFDQAVDYMAENSGLPQGMVQGEIGRYIAWPGQSTAYLIGMLEILELRQRAMEQLGDQFDLKEFHSVLLKNGSMPLNVLEQVVQDYIDAKLAAQ